MTPPHGINIYQNGSYDDDSMELFVNNVYDHFTIISRVKGEKNITEKFSEKWTEKTKNDVILEKNLGLYKLEKVNKYLIPGGIFRIATLNDKKIIKEYFLDFSMEINDPVNDDEKFDKNIEENIVNGLYYVWENIKIVSMAKKVRPTKNGMAINSVYTPKQFRKMGYGTAVVSELSKNILNSGKSFCTLFTDLSNPISNSIYQKIGYVWICDNISYRFIEKRTNCA